MRCRYCRNKGHNRNSCPDAAKDAEVAKAKLANGASHYELPWNERFAHSIAEKKENRKAVASTTPRKCSYCSGEGHTRAKCADLIDDRTKMFNVEKDYRQRMTAWIATSGFGMGAIIQRVNNGGHDEFSCLLTGFNTNALTCINHLGEGTNLQGTYMDRKGWENERFSTRIFKKGCWKPAFELIAPSPIPFEIDPSWVSDDVIKAFVDTLFDEKQTRRTRWNNQTLGMYHTTRPNFERITSQINNFFNS